MESGNPFQLIETLTEHDVDFLVIGGHAVAFHGYPRATEDTDVVFRRTPENEKALLNALTTLNARWIADDIDPETGIERQVRVTEGYIRATHLMMLITDYGFLDIFDYIPGFPSEPVQGLFADSETANGVNYVSLEWLRRMKEASGRTKDLLDLEKLV
jgi:hypothetical protein